MEARCCASLARSWTHLVPKGRVAEALGVTSEALAELENGLKLPSVAQLRRLAPLFNLDAVAMTGIYGLLLYFLFTAPGAE